jgi:hypothetical protein
MQIRHGRVRLEVHELAHGDGLPLLLLHELYGGSDSWPGAVSAWPGAVYGLDFCGHGASEWVRGGAYTPELLVGDADAALHQLGSAAVAGAGIGAYVALLLAGARAGNIPLAILLPGAGLAGHGAWPDFKREERSFDVPSVAEGKHDSKFDPMVRMLDRDVRPVDYARQFADAAQRLLFVEDGGERPSWWQAARAAGKAAARTDLATALAQVGASAA